MLEKRTPLKKIGDIDRAAAKNNATLCEGKYLASTNNINEEITHPFCCLCSKRFEWSYNG